MRLNWLVHELWAQAEHLPIETVRISDLNVEDSAWWFEGRCPTLRELVPHVRRILQADLYCPILLMEDNWVLDGGHRIAKALVQGINVLPAKRFRSMPVGAFLSTS